MTRFLYRACLLLLLPLLASCLKAETTVKVAPDGSGTLVERMVVSHETVEMLASMAPEGEPFSMFNEEELSDKASDYGEGVRLVAARPIETDFGTGYEAEYAFADVTQLKIDNDPGSRLPDGEDGPPPEQEKVPEITTFGFEPGPPAVLAIRWPVQQMEAGSGDADAPSDGSDEAAAEEPAPEELEMVKEMMGGLEMTTTVEVGGQILETNATNRDGNRVTLLHIAFAELLSSEAGLRALVMKEPETLAELKTLMQQLPGLKLEVEPEVTIRFQ